MDEGQLRDMASEHCKDALEDAMRKYEQCISVGSIEAASKRSECVVQLEEIEMISYYDEERNWKNKVIKQNFQGFYIFHCLIDTPYQAFCYYLLFIVSFCEKIIKQKA